MLDTQAVGGLCPFVKPSGDPAVEGIISHKGRPPPSALWRTSRLALRVGSIRQQCSLLVYANNAPLPSATVTCSNTGRDPRRGARFFFLFGGVRPPSPHSL